MVRWKTSFQMLRNARLSGMRMRWKKNCASDSSDDRIIINEQTIMQPVRLRARATKTRALPWNAIG
ncbi:hypothetical protein AAC03nite_06350 [Alicyclobacillus acidoterrestris]|nr:hypothetical protein AAC03nite_06350 [Alicyclobacillus acidoterrestris]